MTKSKLTGNIIDLPESVVTVIETEKWALLVQKINNQINKVEAARREFVNAEQELVLLEALYESRPQ